VVVCRQPGRRAGPHAQHSRTPRPGTLTLDRVLGDVDWQTKDLRLLAGSYRKQGLEARAQQSRQEADTLTAQRGDCVGEGS